MFSGTLGTLFQVFLTIGILIDYSLGKLNSYLILNYSIIAISVAFFVGLFFIPESPQYLIKKNRKGEAETALRRLRGPTYDVSTELNDLRKRNESTAQQKVSFQGLFTKSNVMALVISIGCMVNIKYIMCILYYSVFKMEVPTCLDNTVMDS